MSKNLLREESGVVDWTTVKANNATGGNVVGFSSGWRDGYCVFYWDYDVDGNVTSLFTDIDLLFTGDGK